MCASNYQKIPAELRKPSQWLHYTLVRNPKKSDKKPGKRPCLKWGTPELRKSNLKPLDEILHRKADGFQRYIDKSEGFVYVDLDHARDKDTGVIEPWAQAIVHSLQSYCEVSASGTGLHIVCYGQLPEDFFVAGNPIEIYAGNISKLMALTGDVLDGHSVVEHAQEALEALFKQAKGSDPSKPEVEERCWRQVFHTVEELDSKPSQVYIDGILSEGITFLGGLSSTGKTWIGLSIVHALLTGEKLFGAFKVRKAPMPVIYLVPEMGGGAFRKRCETMHIPMNGLATSGNTTSLGFYCQTIRDGACNLEDSVLLQAIHRTGAAVILDTAIRFQSGDEQSSSQQAQGLGSKLFRLIREGAALVLCMHHRGKDVPLGEPSLENTLRGTGDFGAMADSVWCVEHASLDKGTPEAKKRYLEESKSITRLTLTNVKPRDSDPEDPFTIQGRPYIDQQGDFVVLQSQTEEQNNSPTMPEAVTDDDVIQMVTADPPYRFGR